MGFRDLRVVFATRILEPVFTHPHTHRPFTITAVPVPHTSFDYNGKFPCRLPSKSPGRIKDSTPASVSWSSRNGSDHDCLQNNHISKQLPIILRSSFIGLLRHAWLMASSVPYFFKRYQRSQQHPDKACSADERNNDSKSGHAQKIRFLQKWTTCGGHCH